MGSLIVSGATRQGVVSGPAAIPTSDGRTGAYVPPADVSSSGPPAAYLPSRLGSDLLVGEDWSGLTIGSDAGFASLQAYGGFYVNNTPQSTVAANPSLAAIIAVESHPVWGQVVRCHEAPVGSHPEIAALGVAYEPTISREYPHAAWGATVGQQLWVSVIAQYDKNGNASYSATGADVNGLNDDGTLSNTNKVWFEWTTTSLSRIDQTLANADRHSLLTDQSGDNTWSGSPHALTNGGTETTPVATTPGNLFINSAVTGDLSTSGEYFRMIMGWHVEDATHVACRHFIQRLTTGGGTILSPGSGIVWRGSVGVLTGGTLKNFSKFQLGGNKSDKNRRLFDQFRRWGPFEVSKANDPYGLLGWGI